MGGIFSNITVWTLLAVPASILAIVIHEVCHGLAASLLGDPTAREMKRLSFNPLRHVDPVGLILLIVVGFGWAKPVMVDMRYFKNPKRGMALVALAGPASNFVLAIIGAVCVRITLMFSGTAAVIFFYFFSSLALRSLGLGIFNLFPIPPLDGSKVLGALLPDRVYYSYMRFERYGFIVLAAMVMLGVLNTPLAWLMEIMSDGLYGLLGMSLPRYSIFEYHYGLNPTDFFNLLKVCTAGG